MAANQDKFEEKAAKELEEKYRLARGTQRI
jgi:hypothetical protein